METKLKDHLIKIAESLTNNSTVEDVYEQFALLVDIEESEKQVDQGETLTQKEVEDKSKESTIQMNTIELKTKLLRILEKIEDEQLLRTIYDVLKQVENNKTGKIWKTLSKDQKKEVYASYEESENDTNMTNWDDIKKKY